MEFGVSAAIFDLVLRKSQARALKCETEVLNNSRGQRKPLKMCFVERMDTRLDAGHVRGKIT